MTGIVLGPSYSSVVIRRVHNGTHPSLSPNLEIKYSLNQHFPARCVEAVIERSSVLFFLEDFFTLNILPHCVKD